MHIAWSFWRMSFNFILIYSLRGKVFLFSGFRFLLNYCKSWTIWCTNWSLVIRFRFILWWGKIRVMKILSFLSLFIVFHCYLNRWYPFWISWLMPWRVRCLIRMIFSIMISILNHIILYMMLISIIIYFNDIWIVKRYQRFLFLVRRFRSILTGTKYN